ncbi:hypothetical protein FGO68_gene14962 [Halteria grandinella]|uniref:Casein kinase I n=1 Tax=Halteria grandinella TaxID=5974 RepID=A0A8J8T3N1_HALGN|nr:hypothetical protein FGO68_gene14962 [Halteria grandinella]
MTDNAPYPPEITSNKETFAFSHPLGTGTYGDAYAYYSTTNPQSMIAIKIAKQGQYLNTDSYYLGKLNEGRETGHMVKYYGDGFFNGKAYIKMELVKYSVEEYISLIEPEVGISEAFIMVFLQMLSAIRQLHNKGYIHQDIKPDNFRVTENGVVKLLDLGLVYQYDIKGRHKPFGKFGFKGSPYYASTNALQGFALSRRDDIECLGYSLMQLINPFTPWVDNQSHSKILSSKKHFISSNKDDVPLCYQGIQAFIYIAQQLSYTQEPDYSHFEYLIRNLFRPIEIKVTKQVLPAIEQLAIKELMEESMDEMEKMTKAKILKEILLAIERTVEEALTIKFIRVIKEEEEKQYIKEGMTAILFEVIESLENKSNKQEVEHIENNHQSNEISILPGVQLDELPLDQESENKRQSLIQNSKRPQISSTINLPANQIQPDFQCKGSPPFQQQPIRDQTIYQESSLYSPAQQKSCQVHGQEQQKQSFKEEAKDQSMHSNKSKNERKSISNNKQPSKTPHDYQIRPDNYKQGLINATGLGLQDKKKKRNQKAPPIEKERVCLDGCNVF